MCVFSKPSSPLPLQVAAYDNKEALAQADMEQRLRQLRAGAAADILTSPLGLPAGGRAKATPKLGAVAA